MTAVDRGPADVVDEQPGAIAAALAERGRSERTTKLWEDPHGIWGFLSTVDHKRLGMRYIYTAFAFFFVAGLQALFMRVQLATAESGVRRPADLQRAVHDARHDDDLPVQHAGASPGSPTTCCRYSSARGTSPSRG